MMSCLRAVIASPLCVSLPPLCILVRVTSSSHSNASLIMANKAPPPAGRPQTFGGGPALWLFIGSSPARYRIIYSQ